jgi:hypothetical protein
MQAVTKPKPSVYKREDILSVSQICMQIPGLSGGPCSRQHVHNLIDRGDLQPAFRFGRKRGLFVPKDAVQRYISACRFDPSA